MLREKYDIPGGNIPDHEPVPHQMKGDFSLTAGLTLRAILPAFGLLALNACKQPPDERVTTQASAEERGLAAIKRVGCGACHEIRGLEWPRGRAGPSLMGFDDKTPIAGELANTPANLAAFIRNAPAAVPGSTMPPMPVTEGEARDIAAYLYSRQE